MMRRSPWIVRAVLVATVLTTMAGLAGCGSSSLTSSIADVGNAIPAKDFVGNWSGTDVSIDGTWSGTSGDFAVTPAGQGGGIVITQTSAGLSAQIVGNSRSTTPPLPATLHVDTLSFSVPAASGAPVVWDVQIIDPTTGKALLQVGGDITNTWDLEQVAAIPTG
jgi:hypothetical protein